jgi:hypothetical protein
MSQTIQSDANASPGLITEFREFTLSRVDEAGLIFISCAKLPDIFIAVTDESAVRTAIDTCLRNSFEPNGMRARVFTNGSISGPAISAVVKLTK